MNLANDATDPEMSAITMISGFAGRGGLKRRSIGIGRLNQLSLPAHRR